jgi:uncharacterized membrane protein (DUF485 family)
VLISELNSVLQFPHDKSKTFQKDCIEKLRKFEDPRNDGPKIYKLLLSASPDDKKLFKQYDKKQKSQDKRASSALNFGLYSAEYFAVTGGVMAIGLLATPVIGQLSLLALLGVAVTIGIVAVVMTYVLPKIFQWLKASCETTAPAVEAKESLDNKTSKAMRGLGGSQRAQPLSKYDQGPIMKPIKTSIFEKQSSIESGPDLITRKTLIV